MIQGQLHPDFWRVGETLGKILEQFPGGAAVCVYHEGEKVADIWGGTMDAQGTPWREDTMSVSFSTTKGIASTALHVCADRGLIDYDAPIAKYWPEFGQNGKHEITVRHALTHQAGLFGIRRLIEHADHMLDWDHMVDKLAAAGTQIKPGAGSAYHALTYGWIIGELVRRVSGKTIGEFLQSEVAGPLKLDGLYIGVPEKELPRVARLVDTMGTMKKVVPDTRPGVKRNGGPPIQHRLIESVPVFRRILHALAARGVAHYDFSAPEIVRAQIPAANGVFTARSLARLYAAIANGGHLEGGRILSDQTIGKISRIQLRGRDRVIPLDMQWRLGYHAAFTTKGTLSDGFGHFGFGGSGGFMCPRRRLSVGMVVNGGVGSNLLGDLRIGRIGGAAVESVKARGQSVRENQDRLGALRQSA